MSSEEREFHEYRRVAAARDLPVGEGMQVSVDGREVALFHLESGWYALDNVCPHQGGPLAQGWVEEAKVICPWHAWCFDLQTGCMTLGDFGGVDAFHVRVEGGDVWVATRPRRAV